MKYLLRQLHEGEKIIAVARRSLLKAFALRKILCVPDENIIRRPRINVNCQRDTVYIVRERFLVFR